MSKSPAISTPTEGLMPHQQRVVDKLKKEDQEGLILMHGLGSGKTRSSIEAYKALGLPAEVVAPAALKENYRKEIKKWIGKDPKNLSIHSQQEVARNGLGEDDLTGKLLIVDEAHRMRNEGSKLYDALSKAHPEKRVLLSGTPIYNHPGDIAKLVNMASGMKLMPESRRTFEERYISRTQIPNNWKSKLMGLRPGEHISLKNKDELKGIFNKYIDYHAGNAEGFPTMSSETVRVPMADKQKSLYGTMMKEIPWILRKKIEMGLAPDRRELDKLIPFLTGARMISNGTYGFEKDPNKAVSPKIQKAFEYLKSNMDKDKDYKALIYSNYLDSGVNPYKKMLDEAKIPYGEFSGSVKDSVRNKLVQDYNANKLRALIVSSAGGEGLDLKGTRLVQLLEPHFNNEKLKQVIGRAARYKSHEALSPEKRKVLVQRYLSEVSPTLLQKLMREKSTSTDEYLQNLADEKEKLNNKFLDIIKSGAAMKTAGIDAQIPLAIGGALAGLGSRNLLGHLYEKTVSPMMRKITPLKGKNLREMISSMGLKRKVQVNEPNLMHAAKGTIEEAGYNPNTGHVDFSSARMYRPGIAAHELGHAHIENNPGIMSYLQNNIYPISEKFTKYTTPLVGAAAGYASNHHPIAGAVMGGLGGLLADSGRLLPEFEATRRGIKAMMQSSLPLKEKLKNSASLLPAYLTYLGQSAGSGAVAGGIAGI